MAAVAAVDDGDRRIVGGKAGGAVARMTDHDHVGIVGDDTHGICDALALGGGRGRGIGAGDGVAAEPEHGAFERQPRARAWLVEQRCQDEIRREIGAASDAIREARVGQLLEEGLGQIENGLDIFVRKVVDRDDVARRLGFHARLCVLRARWCRQSRLCGIRAHARSLFFDPRPMPRVEPPTRLHSDDVH